MHSCAHFYYVLVIVFDTNVISGHLYISAKVVSEVMINLNGPPLLLEESMAEH